MPPHSSIRIFCSESDFFILSGFAVGTSILFNAIGYLTHQISFKLPVRSDYKLFIQVQSNVNKMFGSKKKDEIKNITDIQKKVVFQKPPKKQTIDIEIIQDKIGIFNEIDKMIMN